MPRFKTKLAPKVEKRAFPVWLIVTGIGLVLLAVWAFFNSANRINAEIEVTGEPSIKVDQETFNYGDVKLGGTPIKTTVKVTNVGDQTLRFSEAPYIEVLEGC